MIAWLNLVIASDLSAPSGGDPDAISAFDVIVRAAPSALLGGLLTFLLTRIWDRAIPSCHTDAFESRMRSTDPIDWGPEVPKMLDESVRIEAIPVESVPVVVAMKAFNLAISSITEAKSSLLVIDRLLKENANCTEPAERIEFFRKALQSAGLMLSTSIIRDDCTIDGLELASAAPTLIEVVPTPRNRGTTSAKFGPLLVQVLNHGDQQWVTEKCKIYMDVIRTANVPVMVDLLRKFRELEQRQIELHRRLAKTIKPHLVRRQRIVTQAAIANRGNGFLLVHKAAKMQFRSGASTKCNVDCQLELMQGKFSDPEAQLIPMVGVHIVAPGASSLLAVPTPDQLDTVQGGTEILAAAKQGSVEARVKVQVVSFLGIKWWRASAWTRFALSDENSISSKEIP